MDVTELPFNKFVGIRRSRPDSAWLLELDQAPEHLNHLGSFHAAVVYAIAEATSAEALLRRFPELDAPDVLAVVRKSEVKYKAPLTGQLRSSAAIEDAAQTKFLDGFRSKNRGFITVTVDVDDSRGARGATASFEWFVRRSA